MTFQEYHAWEQEQEEFWELVNGRPVLRSERWDRDPVTGMSGATRAHNIIVSDVLRHAGNRLEPGRRRALASHMKHRSAARSARYPDAAIECGPADMQGLLAENTRVIFEVLSKSNTLAQQMLLLADYQAIETLGHMIFLEQQRPAVVFWTRHQDGWRAEEIVGLDAVLPLTAVGIELPLAEVYQGLSFET